MDTNSLNCKEKMSLREVQNRELSILLKFDEFCKQNDVDYRLCGGTLLGAVRHRGFIPWDDDIDVMLPRPEYDKLVNCLKRCGNSYDGIEFKGVELSNGDFPFLKACDSRVRIDGVYKFNDPLAFLWIDIFPIDGLLSNEKQLKRVFFLSKKLRMALSSSYYRFEFPQNIFRGICKAAIYPILCAVGSRYWGTAIVKLCKRYNFEECDWIGGICWGYGPQECMPKKEWLERVKVEFEGHEFWAPGCWDLYLRNLYGDYMKLPPEEKRITHSIIAYVKE